MLGRGVRREKGLFFFGIFVVTGREVELIVSK